MPAEIDHTKRTWADWFVYSVPVAAVMALAWHTVIIWRAA